MTSDLKTRNISNSQVSVWRQCKRRHYYAFDLGLEPKKSGSALSRGILGHTVLEKYYGHLAKCTYPYSENEYNTAEQLGFEVLTQALSRGMDLELVTNLRHVLIRYFDYARRVNKDWNIVSAERRVEIELTDEFRQVGRIDLLAYIDGELTIVDHKFTYNFWNTDKLDLNPQLPKYMALLRNEGLPVRQAAVNQIRYRVRKSSPYADEEMFRLDKSYPSQTLQRGMMREQILASREIIEHTKLPLNVREVESTRNFSACQFCSFPELCLTELNGGSIEHMIMTEYKQSEYGYNDVPTDLDELDF